MRKWSLMKIHIVDDTPGNLKRLSVFCRKQGFDVVTATNGKEAIEVFLSESPDLILMDVTMPVMNGFEATTKIKALAKDHWVPIILVTSLDNEDNLIKGMESGVDDFLSSPVNFKILHEKIKVMKRLSGLQKNLNINLKELKEYHDKAEMEISLAKNVMDKIIGLSNIDQNALRHWIMPAQHFSGDIIAATKTHSNKLYAFIADVAGHGLQAALMVLPISQIFYTMAETGCSIVSIAEELNYRVHQQIHTGGFVAATFIIIDTFSGTIEVWNGGNPPLIIMNHQGEILHSWKSIHLPLGILNKEAFNAKTEIHTVKSDAQLFICSDGLLEAQGEDNKFFGPKKMISVLRKEPPEHRFTALVDAVKKHLGNQLAHDDISLVEIQYRPEKQHKSIAQDVKKKKSKLEESGSWKLSLQLGSEKLRLLSVVPILLKWINLLDIRKSQSGAIFVVLSELYTNALDHGLLKLDSKLKQLPDGFDLYFSERKSRLENLNGGTIEIEISKITSDGKLLQIHIKDSGEGFAHEMDVPLELTAPSGRGIPLIKSLCKEVRYLGDGNEAIVHFELD